jgi:O-antigen ligase
VLSESAASVAPGARAGAPTWTRMIAGAGAASIAAAAAALLLVFKGVALSLAVFAAGLFAAFLFAAPTCWLAMLLVVFIPFNTLISQWLGGFESGSRQWFTLWKEALLAVGIVRAFWSNPRRAQIIAANRLALIFGGLLVFVYAATLLRAPSVAGVYAFSLDTKFIAVMAFFLFLDLDAKQTARLLRAMVWSVGLVALYGLIQCLWDYERLLPLVYNTLDVFAGDTPRLYSYALTALEPAFESVIAILILFTGASGMSWRKSLPLLALLIPCLLLTFTRSAYLGLPCGMIAVCLIDGSRSKRYAAVAIAAAGIVSGTFLFGSSWVMKSGVIQRFESIVSQSDLSSEIHKERMKRTIEVISQHPLGVGLGEYGTVQARFGGGYYEAEYAENATLQVAVETGVIGGIVYVAWNAVVFLALLRTRRSASDDTRRLGACALGVFVALTLAGILLPVWEALVPVVYAWGLAGCVLSRASAPAAAEAQA